MHTFACTHIVYTYIYIYTYMHSFACTYFGTFAMCEFTNDASGQSTVASSQTTCTRGWRTQLSSCRTPRVQQVVHPPGVGIQGWCQTEASSCAADHRWTTHRHRIRVQRCLHEEGVKTYHPFLSLLYALGIVILSFSGPQFSQFRQLYRFRARSTRHDGLNLRAIKHDLLHISEIVPNHGGLKLLHEVIVQPT